MPKLLDKAAKSGRNGRSTVKVENDEGRLRLRFTHAGKRLGEAVALKWKYISDDCRTVWIGESVSRGVRKTTKTGKDRTVNLTARITKMLLERKPANCNPESLVFPSPTGVHISDHTFRRGAWKTILSKLKISYRKPYATRHTAIMNWSLSNSALQK